MDLQLVLKQLITYRDEARKRQEEISVIQKSIATKQDLCNCEYEEDLKEYNRLDTLYDNLEKAFDGYWDVENYLDNVIGEIKYEL